MVTRESAGLLRPTVLMAIAFAFGAVHAITPGHGKSIVISYFLGQGGVARRGVAMSAKVIATHVLSAIALVGVTTFVIDASLGMRPADFLAVRLISLSMALDMIVTVSLFALAVILCRRWLLDFLRRHDAHVERIARGLEILGAAAVTVLGLLLFSSESSRTP